MAKNDSPTSLARQLRAMDTKDRNFLNKLAEEDRRSISPYLTMRYSANVEGIPELQEYYLLAANERMNPHYFTLKKYPELQWLLCTTVSPNMGVHRHYFLKYKKNEVNTRMLGFLEDLYPHFSDNELELMLSLNDAEDIKTYARQMGWDEKKIRDEL